MRFILFLYLCGSLRFLNGVFGANFLRKNISSIHEKTSMQIINKNNPIERKGNFMTQTMYSIREAAEVLGVETHALRYWEEELELAISRNAQGRRWYTEADIETFRDIINWKEEGLQLKNIKQLLHKEKTWEEEETGRRIIVYRPKELQDDQEKEVRARRLQELLKEFISDSIRESNAELLQMLKEGLLKELDYQFRLQEEREEEREKVRIEKEDEHFKRLDENLRNAMERKGRKKRRFGK